MHIYLINLLFFIVLSLFGVKVIAEIHTDHSLRFNAQDLTATDQDIFSAQDTSSLFAAIDMSMEAEGIRIAATANWNKEGEQSETDLQFSEAFYDFSWGNWLLSAGKKKLDWDVGYGFRPLDMFSPTDSLAIYNAVPPGAVMLVGDYFTDVGNISLLCNETSPDYLQRGMRVAKGGGCGGRYYQYFDHFEAQWVTHYDEKLGVRLGGSGQTVIGESLELHGSLLWQENYRTPSFNKVSVGDTFIPEVETQWRRGAIQSLFGMNYSLASGMTVIAEYWHDGRAPSDGQWREVLHASKESKLDYAQKILRGHFANQNLFRDNLMLHLRASKEVWRPELTWVLNPNDGSMFIDGQLCYHGKSERQLCSGLRQYAGGDESIYEHLSYQTSWYFEIEVKL